MIPKKMPHYATMKSICGNSLICIVFCSLTQMVAQANPRNSVGKVWHFDSTDTQIQIEQHKRHPSYEEVVVRTGLGTYCFFEKAIHPVHVIHDLKIRADVVGAKKGVQIAARVVFPYAQDESGELLNVTILGQQSVGTGKWERITCDRFPQKVARKIQVLRLEHGSQIDVRRPFVDRIKINVLCAPGKNHVLMGDTFMKGAIKASHATEMWRKASRVEHSVALDSGMLRIDGRPFFPRILEYQGEPFEFLIDLGINCIYLKQPPTESQVLEGSQVGMWFICDRNQLNLELGSPRAQRIIAVLDARNESNSTRYESKILVVAHTNHSQVHFADMILHPSTDPQTNRIIPFEQLRTRIEKSRRKPNWSIVDLQGRDEGKCQDQLTDETLISVASGAQGIWFRSRAQLSLPNQSTTARPLARVNATLKQLQPWLFGGHIDQIGNRNQRTWFKMSHPRGCVFFSIPEQKYVHLDTDVFEQKFDLQISLAQTHLTRKPLPTHLVLPVLSGVAGTFLMEPEGPKPLQNQRVAGGFQIQTQIDKGPIVIPNDRRVVRSLTILGQREQKRMAKIDQMFDQK